MKVKYVSLVPLIVLALLFITVSQAQAKELVKVTIVGPGLKREVELTDAESLQVFRELGFADQPYQPASIDTEPYFEFRMALGNETDIVATGVYHYFPVSNSHPSYIYYAPAINAWSSRDGQYFLIPEDTDGKLRTLMVHLGASFPKITNQPTAAIPSSLVQFILSGCFGVIFGIAIKLKLSLTNKNH